MISFKQNGLTRSSDEIAEKLSSGDLATITTEDIKAAAFIINALEGRLKDATHQRDILAEDIQLTGRALGVCKEGDSLTGPELMKTLREIRAFKPVVDNARKQFPSPQMADNSPSI